MSQLAFFLNELFCPVHTGRCKWKSFGGGTSMWKAADILIVNSWGIKAACLELYIHILGALAYLSNHQYSGRYSSYQNWSLNCNASRSLKYCWSSCPENSAWTSFMPLFLLDKTTVKTVLKRLLFVPLTVTLVIGDHWTFFFLSDLFFLLSVIKERGRKLLTSSHSNPYQ